MQENSKRNFPTVCILLYLLLLCSTSIDLYALRAYPPMLISIGGGMLISIGLPTYETLILIICPVPSLPFSTWCWAPAPIALWKVSMPPRRKKISKHTVRTGQASIPLTSLATICAAPRFWYPWICQRSFWKCVYILSYKNGRHCWLAAVFAQWASLLS